ncbi:glycosyltransferase [Bacillus sp. DNRA2]|uniref:glycosyltransferase family 2 protein n=1 Tax=Bacillus sp. DNRA2 TaxID=2723053 RepID=UPI00145E674A|nr:glycosyltransferase [Bacillus sp. DNRA2]NMD71168.1 glycosyltransferase [Bacillus sp. DNRA2]
MEPTLTIVIPCYNEEAVLRETINQLNELINQLVEDNLISKQSMLLFVDDGSKDSTWGMIYKEGLKNERIKGLKLARNVGHQRALLAGLLTAKERSDCVISIDADLQDDINVIREFIMKYQEGYEVVYGVRDSRKSDSFFKRNTAQGYYRLMEKLGVSLVYNHADYRLMSKRALEELEKFEEVNLFLRGIVPLIGFRSTSVYYARKERLAGVSKYPLKKMLSFALDGITSFSITPIRLVLFSGLTAFLISLLFGVYFFWLKMYGSTVTGWTSLITSIWLIGGLQLIAIGLIGEYIGKMYIETKRRPKYVIDINTFQLPQAFQANGNKRLTEEAVPLNFAQYPK